MAQKLIYYDGLKHADLNSDDPSVWTFLSGGRQTLTDEYYSRVAAAFRAFNLKANTVGGMPFCLYKASAKNGKKALPTGNEQIDDAAEDEEFDSSATWENKVGFLPNPSELFRLDTLSYMTSNTVYNVRTTDALGYKQRGLYHAVASTFTPETDPVSGALVRIWRQVGASREEFKPEDKRLFRAWRLDHTTEVLPSPNTEARAIMHAAGVMYYADFWVQNFYRRGGIKPTLIAMKGLIGNEAKEDKEKSWTDFLRGLGRFTNRIARIFNAESMDIQSFGSGVDDMKDNKIYEQALANIAMGVGMPLSLLMANSANYATAKEEKATWYENDIIPLCNWLAYEYNRQIFEPIGLRLEFKPETLDPQQEDETERAQAMSAYMKVVNECPTYEVFEGMAAMMGLEMPDELKEALKKLYADKQQKEKELQERMQQGGYEIGPDGKPIPAQAQPKDGEKPAFGKPKDMPMDDEPEEEEKPAPPAKWTPTIDQLDDLRIYREVALRRLKKGDSMDFEYQPHHEGGLPADVVTTIKTALVSASTPEAVKAAFDAPVKEYEVFQMSKTLRVVDVDGYFAEQEQSDLKALADSMNKMAEAIFTTKSTPAPVRADPSNINITMPAISLTAQMPEQGTVTVNVPQQPAPTVNVTMPEQLAPVVNVAAPKVVVMDGGPKDIDIVRRDGKITGAKVK